MLEVRTIEQFTKLQDIFIKQKNIWFFVVLFCVLVILVGMIFYSCLQKHQKIQVVCITLVLIFLFLEIISCKNFLQAYTSLAVLNRNWSEHQQELNKLEKQQNETRST